jgi:hypothetical protein
MAIVSNPYSAPTDLAPVAVFAFKRPKHLARMLASLAANAEAVRTDVVVFCDAPRNKAEAAAVAEVRALVDSIRGFASVRAVHREQNLGLARSIIEGVTSMLDHNGRVIVVEDDLELSPHFLRFMNDGLACYAHDDRVASIHGYSYPARAPLPETFFLRGADCWGWATWSRAWAGFISDGQRLLYELRSKGLASEFDLDGAYPFTTMLAEQIAGRNDSWAVRWHASCFLADQLTLYPGRSLVHNIGNDASGTHRGDTEAFAQALVGGPIWVDRLPLEPSHLAREAFKTFLRQHRPPAPLRLLQRFKRALRGAR